jgi:hypothetical protein
MRGICYGGLSTGGRWPWRWGWRMWWRSGRRTCAGGWRWAETAYYGKGLIAAGVARLGSMSAEWEGRDELNSKGHT